MKTHELAKLLLEQPDTEVQHHYYSRDVVDDEGYDWYHEPEVIVVDGKVLISTGEILDCVEFD